MSKPRDTKVDSLSDKLRRGIAQLPYLWRALGLIWAAARGWTAAWLALLVLQGLLPVATVYLTRLLVNSLAAAVNTGGQWENARPVLVWVSLMAAVMLLQVGLRSATSLIRAAQSEQVRDYLSGLVHQKSVEVDLAFYDSPGYYDQLHRARSGAIYRPIMLLESIGALLQNTITLVAMLAVLLPYSAWLPLALLVSTLPALYIVLHHRLRLRRWTVKNTENERRVWYYDWLLTAREAAVELRLFHLSDHFRDAYQKLRQQLRIERFRLAKDQGLSELAAGAAALLITGAAMLWMAWRTVLGQVSLGDLALFYQAFNQGQGLMRSFLENVGEIYNSSFFLSDLFEFLELKSGVLEPEQPIPAPAAVKQGIRLESVTFSYPGSDRPALRDFNLTLQANQIAAIVGPNGAGKSTLIKLLCRFYDPQAGSIAIDGVDLHSFSTQDLRQHITVLFQEPVHYNATARENIWMGDISLPAMAEEISAAARGAGADIPISHLPQGYDTLLGKWFQGGADLSAGEWQRMALARAFLRASPIIILDEPTSAMDPWAEADWLVRFRRLAAGRTAILITHRFTTAAYADVIHVMDEGQIVESGSHQQLLEGSGRYAASWREQMRRWLEASQPPHGGDASA